MVVRPFFFLPDAAYRSERFITSLNPFVVLLRIEQFKCKQRMSRPRLVEEGAPIYGPGSEQAPRRVVEVLVDDHEMDDDHERSHDRRQHETIAPTKTPTSSLQRVAMSSGIQIPSKRTGTRLQTSYEIGGGRSSQEKKITQTQDFVNHHHQNYYVHSIQADHTTIGTVDDAMEMEAEHIQGPTPGTPLPPQMQSHLPNHHHDAKNHHHPAHHASSSQMKASSYVHVSHPPATYTSYTIGETPNVPTEKMVGVEDHGHKTPLVVIDGANVAHAYGVAMAGMYNKGRGEVDPDATGIDVAVQYLSTAQIRILIVLPQYWFRGKGRWNNMGHEQEKVLNTLQGKGLIVASPPADDDDAYALTIARREESRSMRRPNGEGPGFILSNDMFRDAQARDATTHLRHWLNEGRDPSIGPGRISYSFADMGTLNDHGERILDFVPNPRHPLVVWIENLGLQGVGATAV